MAIPKTVDTEQKQMRFRNIAERSAWRETLDEQLEAKIENMIENSRMARFKHDPYTRLGIGMEPGKVGFAPFYEAISFSSFTLSKRDSWGFTAKRPFEIVILPGYTIPDTLDTRSCDAIWIDGDIEKEFVIWDGYEPVALFELIYECIDPDRTSEFVKIRDRDKGEFLEDPRPAEYLARRPKSVIDVKYNLHPWTKEVSGSMTKAVYDDAGNLQSSGITQDWRMRNRLLARYMPMAKDMYDGFNSRDRLRERLPLYPFEVNVEAPPRLGLLAQEAFEERDKHRTTDIFGNPIKKRRGLLSRLFG